MSATASDVITIFDGAPASDRRVATLLAYLGGHRAVVDAGGGGLLEARCLATIDESALAQAASRGGRASVVFERDDPTRPIVTELLPPALAAVPRDLEVRADGVPSQLRIDAAEELVLQCGRASITLQRDGRVLIKGVHVETRASGTNRIKGAQVRIN